MSGVKLCVNVDHVATVRQARGGVEPDPVECGMICEDHGAYGITVHLREDRRHIQERDVAALRDVVRGKFNLEMALSEDVIGVARRILPDQVTLVPEKREELTTEGGLDVAGHLSQISDLVSEFHEKKIEVSLFVEPESSIIEASVKTGADFIEIHTGTYCNASGAAIEREINRMFDAARIARELGIGINAGHGLNYTNLGPVLKIEGLQELNIGHSIISRSIITGMGRAVEEMLEVISTGT